MMSQGPQGQQPIAPTMKLTITLEAQQWNGVLAALSEAPYKLAAPLIQTMGEQLNGQTSGQAVPSLGNHLDRDPLEVPQ